jgi:glycosyltransferase involved in cell wall biosynthesis
VPLFDPDASRAEAVPPPREGRPPLAALVPVQDALPTIAPCLEALWRNLGPDDRLVVADAGSRDGTREYLELFARERGGRVRLVDAPPGAGLPGAVRAAAPSLEGRPLAVLVQPLAAVPPGFLDALTALLEGPEATAVVALPAPPAGLCAAGAAALLARVAEEAPASFYDPGADALEAALRPLGASLGIVEQEG